MTVNIQHVVCAYETQSFISITYLNLEFLKIFRIFFLVCMFCPFYHGSASLSYWPYCPCQHPWLLWCATYLKMSCVCTTVLSVSKCIAALALYVCTSPLVEYMCAFVLFVYKSVLSVCVHECIPILLVYLLAVCILSCLYVCVCSVHIKYMPS